MITNTVNRQIRIFISSTFQDMMLERDYLINKTFPKLRELASKRNVEIIPVDLRWGITEEESKSGKVIEVCLDEIVNSHPFFIGLLGSRYGWCPSENELVKNKTLTDKYQWIVDDIHNGLSVTEIEIQYGVLRNPEQIHAFFYQRKISALDMDNRLESLRQRIECDGRYPICGYESVSDLGVAVEKDFSKVLDDIFPEEDIPAYIKERLAHEQFLEQLRQYYEPNENDYNHLDAFLSGCDHALVISALSGCGKSALVANWLKALPNGTNYIYHAVDKGFFHADYRSILIRFCLEIEDLYELEENEYNLEECGATEHFERVLSKINGRVPLLIILDGTNKLTDIVGVRSFTWMPELPSNVKIIYITTPDDEMMEAFSARKYPQISVSDMSSSTKYSFIDKYLGLYRKKLTESQKNRIVQCRFLTNPLMLRVFLEELVSFGSFEGLDKYIDNYIQAKDADEFFQLIVEKYESLFDNQIVQRALSLIVYSRFGLPDYDLREIMKVSQLEWSLFFCSFRRFLAFQHTCLTVAQTQFADYLKKRYANRAEDTHRLIIGYYENNPCEKAHEELPFSYCSLRDWDSLYGFVINQTVLPRFFCHDEMKLELRHYWTCLLSQGQGRYQLSCYLDLDMEGQENAGRLLLDIGHFISKNFIGNEKTSYSLMKKALSLSDGSDRILIMTEIGELLATVDDYENAIKYCEDALDIFEKQDEKQKDDQLRALLYNNLAGCYLKKGDNQQAQSYFHKALLVNLNNLAADSFTIVRAYINLAACSSNLGNKTEAFDLLMKAHDLIEQNLGVKHAVMAIVYRNMGGLFLETEQYDKALTCFGHALKIYTDLYNDSHMDVAGMWLLIRDVYERQGFHDKAYGAMRARLNIVIKLFGKHPGVAKELSQTARMAYSLHNYEDALHFFQQCYIIRKEVLEPNHPDTAACLFSMGSIFSNFGDYTQMMNHYLASIQMCEDFFGGLHMHSYTMYQTVATEAMEHGDYKLAFENIQKANTLAEKAEQINILDLARNYNKTAVILQSMGDIQAAISYHEKSYQYFLQCYGSNNDAVKQIAATIKVLREEMNNK